MPYPPHAKHPTRESHACIFLTHSFDVAGFEAYCLDSPTIGQTVTYMWTLGSLGESIDYVILVTNIKVPLTPITFKCAANHFPTV